MVKCNGKRYYGKNPKEIKIREVSRVLAPRASLFSYASASFDTTLFFTLKF